MNIKKGDSIKILRGKDKGKTGKVFRVDGKEEKIFVEGLNMFKKHVRPKRKGEKGEMVQVVRPLPRSKVMLVCSSCGASAKTGYRFEGMKKIRYCKKCKNAI